MHTQTRAYYIGSTLCGLKLYMMRLCVHHTLHHYSNNDKLLYNNKDDNIINVLVKLNTQIFPNSKHYTIAMLPCMSRPVKSRNASFQKSNLLILPAKCSVL